jgi:hypothetical protein
MQNSIAYNLIVPYVAGVDRGADLKGALHRIEGLHPGRSFPNPETGD